MQEGQTGSVTPPQWEYKADEMSQAHEPAPAAPAEGVTWTASEYVAHQKTSTWYVALAVIGLAGAALVYILTRDMVSAVVIAVVATIFGVFAARQPRVLEYRLDDHGLKIADKYYPYGIFKTFAVIQEGGIESISLVPLKRFMPILSIYFDPADAEKIINILSNYLPHEERQPDPIDRLMRHLRF